MGLESKDPKALFCLVRGRKENRNRGGKEERSRGDGWAGGGGRPNEPALLRSQHHRHKSAGSDSLPPQDHKSDSQAGVRNREKERGKEGERRREGKRE